MHRTVTPQNTGNMNSRDYSNGTEVEKRNHYYPKKLGDLFPVGSGNGSRYTRLQPAEGNDTDPEDDDKRSTLSIDEFGENQNYANRLLRTGRQRKKLAARSKGGEFRQRRKKRRLYFCCLSSEIDVQKLFDHLVGAESLSHGWKYQLYADVLHLYKAGIEEPQRTTITDGASSSSLRNEWSEVNGNSNLNGGHSDSNYSISHSISEFVGLTDDEIAIEMSRRANGSANTNNADGNHLVNRSPAETQWSDSSRISGIGAQEVFVFDFGSAVFWGFSRGEETNLLKTIRMFVTKGFVHAQEFQSGEDDMAFVCVPTADAEIIAIANDVITLPDDTTTKQRMSVSFAIAQSTVLAIFEARVELKVEDYRYIPETLAASGKVQLTERQLGMMIGNSMSSIVSAGFSLCDVKYVFMLLTQLSAVCGVVIQTCTTLMD